MILDTGSLKVCAWSAALCTYFKRIGKLQIFISKYNHITTTSRSVNLDFLSFTEKSCNFSATKMIFVVTSDTINNNEQELSLSEVQQKVKEINRGIVRSDKFIVISWEHSPSDQLQELLNRQLRTCVPKPRQTIFIYTALPRSR